MLLHIFATALLSLTVSANVQNRQATDAGQFTSAADELISKYIPSTALPALESAVSSAASAAQVTGEPLSLIYEALLSNSVPGWFSSGIPSAWSTQIAALESNINALRASTSPGGPIVSAATVITTTDSAGSTITTTSGLGPTSSITVTSTSVSGEIITTTTTPSGTGTATTGTATGAGSAVSALTTEVISGVTSIFSTAVSKASSVASAASSAVSTSSSAGGALPTSVSGAAVGLMGIMGLIAAL